jgi:hypothetical protein
MRHIVIWGPPSSTNIRDASVNRAILQHCFFWFGNTGADAATAILLPTLKRFSCNAAVDWSTTCFCCESVLRNGDGLVIAQREFRREFGIHRNRAVPSVHAIKTWVRNFEATGSTLKKKSGSLKTVGTTENIAVVRGAIVRIPHCPARRHSVTRDFTHGLLFYPYKI